MSHDSTRPDAGQVTDPSIIEVLERNVQAIVRMSAVLTRLSERIDAIEARTSAPQLGDDEPVTERHPDVIPPLALLADGRVLLHVSEVEGLDLAERDTWSGLVLSEAEAADVLGYLSDGVSEAAGRTGAWILRAAKRGKKTDEEGGES